MEDSLPIEEDRIVTGANPIAVAVDQRIVERQKPEHLVDIEHWRESLLKLIEWRFIERFAQLDQRLPILVAVVGLQAEGLFVVVDVVADVLQPAASHRAATDLPTRSLCAGIILGEEVLVELLDTRVDAPTLTVDRHLDEVGLRCWDVLPGDVRVQDRVQKRRVFVRVQQVEGLVTVEPLLRIRKIK